MSIIKKKNPITGKWEVFSATTASEIPLLDIKNNFTNKNVEGALREVADKNKEIEAKLKSHSTVIQEHSSTLNTHTEDIEYLKVNGGGGGGTSAPTITSKFEDGTIVQKGEDVKIPIFFSSPNQGTGTAYIVIDGVEVDSVSGIKQGNNTINIGKLTNLRTSVGIYVKDRANMLSNQLEWTIICGGIDLEVNFDDTADYGVTDEILMQFTVASASSEPIIMHMTIDYDTYEVECNQGVNEYMFVGLGVGIHKISFYLTSGEYLTPTINYNIVIVSSSSLFVSSDFEGGEFTNGTPVAIQYRISKASDEYFNVKLYLNDKLEKTLSVQAGTYYWTINDLDVGEYSIRIEVISAYEESFIIEKTFTIIAGEYTPLRITESGLVYRLSAKGRTNQDSDRANPTDNSGNGIKATLHNFNWYTNGWIDDELVCDSNAYVEIDYYPWADNAIYGSTIEIQFTGLDIGFNEARILDYTDVETPYKGVYVDLEETTMKSLANTGKVNIDQNVETTITFVIDRKNKFGKIYVDGICSRAFSLSDTGSGTSAVREDFTHTQKIYLNSRKGEDKFGACKIKDLRIYSRTLSDDEIVKNNIAQITNLDKQERIYKLNYENTTLPVIRMYGDTTNMTLETPVTMRVKYTSPNEDKYGQSFDLPYCTVNWQGTSSLQYVLKNFTVRLKDENMADYYYSPYPNGILENTYCLKCDYMESTHARNVGLAKFVNDCLYDTKNPAQQKDANIRNSIAGFPILLYINDELQGVYNFNLDRYSTKPYGYTDTEKCLVYEVSANSDTTAGAFYKWSESSGKSQLDYYKSDFECLYPPTRANGNDNMSELIRLIEWVNDSSDEDFKDNIGRYFNLEYLLRYYLFVLVFGAVDSLGKNMKLTTWDGLVWYPQVYDADTTIGLDNTGFLKFDMDIEMGDKNVFNTTGSQLWKKVVLLFDAELKQQYSLMRQDRFTVDNIMKYLYGEQISQIPAYYYNKDMQTKYLNFGSSYLYALHGSGEQHIRKWIRERLMYCDTLLGYRASSSDYITLRSSKLGEVYLDVETYIPMYLSIKWRDEANNTGLQTKRVGRGEKVRFTYNMPTATDQEIIVYAGHYLKSLGDVSNLQPTSMLIANADRLTEIECHSPNLINTDLSECTKLQRIDLSDCTALGTGIGAQPILNIQNCKYLRYCNCMNTQLTAIYTMQAGGNLEEIYYPQSIQVVQLTNQTYLHTIGLPSTNPCENLANVQITNCNAVKTLSSEAIVLDFNTLKYVQNLNITNSLSGLNSMQFNGFDKLKNVTLSSLKELDSIGFEDMMPVTTTSTLKTITISDCPLITSLSFNVSSDDYKVAFASGGKLDLGGLQSLKSIECNTSVKGLDTLIVPTSLTDLRFTTEHGDGINEIKNIWSASAVHNDDGFEGIDFQDMTIEFIDMLGLNGISNAINFHIAPKTQNPNLNTARDGSTDKPWFHPIGSIDLSNYTGLMIGMLRGVDLNKLDVVINTNRDQVDLTSLFECATLPTAQNIVTKTNNILAKFPKSVIWDYMFRGCDLSFSPKDITIPNRGLSLKGMYKDSNVTEDVSLPNVIMAVDEMFMNCTGVTTYEKNWLKTYAKIAYTVPASNGTSGSWDDSGNYTEGTNYNQFLYTPSDGEKAFKIMTTGTGVVRINYFHNASFMSRVVYTPKFDSYPYVVTIPDGCNKVIFVCDKTIGFASEGTITTSNCYTNTGGVLSEIPVSWGGYGLDKNVTSIYVIDTTHLTNTTTFNLVLQDNQAGITDWGDGVTNSEKSHTYAEHGVYTIKTKSWSNGTPSDDLKNALIEVKQIKLIGHNGNSKDYSNAFDGCSKLTKVTAYDLAPTNCNKMFSGCSSLTEIVGLDTWDMSNCTNINGMFQNTSITDPTPVYNMLSTFTGSSANSLFRESKIESIELGRFPSSIKNFGNIARGCTNLKTIDFTGASHNVINWSDSFNGCSNVTSLISLETLNASDGVDLTNMMDRVGTRLETIDMSGMTCKIGNPTRFNNGGHTLKTIKLGWDWINVTRNPDYFLADFYSLENIEWGTNIKINIVDSWKINEQQKLTVQSLVNLFNALYNFSTDGGTHTVIIGATNIAKLTREQMLIAIKKHWTIQGAPIQGVFRDTDISTLTSDDTVTAVAIELTADNYLTRIDEVLGVYTNAVDVYFMDDGSVTTLASMCDNNNTSTKNRIQNVTFIEGYFENCNSFGNTFHSCTGLVTVTNIPDNITHMSYAFFNNTALTTVSNIPSKCTHFGLAFRGCRALTSVPENGWTGDLMQVFFECSSLNQQINIVDPIDLVGAFVRCSSLETSPTFTGIYTGKIDNLFNECSKLTNIVLPTTWRPSSAQSTFSGCTQLVTIENLDALDMSNCYNCFNMFNSCGLQDYSSIENWNLSSCSSFANMFENAKCTGSIDISKWTTSTGAVHKMFNGSYFTSINVSNLVKSSHNNISEMFRGARASEIIGMDTWDTSNIANWFYAFGGCSNLKELNISNWVFKDADYNTAWIWVGTSFDKIIANNIYASNPSKVAYFLNDPAKEVKCSVKEFIMDEINPNQTNFSGMFEGTNIKNDIIFPNWATNVSNCFKNCTGITHIHSNWNNPYVLTINHNYGNSNTDSDFISVSDVETVYFESSANSYLRCIGYDSNKNFIGYYNYAETPSWVNKDTFRLTSSVTIQINRDDIKYIKFGAIAGNVSITKTYKSKNSLENTTDCYAGCTGITHCDGVDLGVNEYIAGLDEVPVAWGGFGFDKNVTSIAVVEIPSDNYEFQVCTYNGSITTSTGTINWGDGTITTGSRTHTYATAGTYTIKGHFAFGYYNPSDSMRDCLIEVKQIAKNGSSQDVKNFRSAFYNCSKLTKVTTYNLTPTTCDSMFRNCSSLTELVGLDTWDMSNCTNINGMFQGAGITDPTPVYDMLSTFTGSSAESLFRESKIESIEFGRFPSSIKDFGSITLGCPNLRTIDFTNCVQNTTNWGNAFRQVKGVESMIGLETFNASDGVTLGNMFFNADLSNVGIIDMSGMICKIGSAPSFPGTKVTTIKMGFDWSNITENLPDYMFSNFNTLENVEWGTNLKSSFNNYTYLHNHNKLTVQSLLNLFNALYDFSTDSGTHTVVIGNTNLAKLTDEQIAIATNKGWTVN